MPRRLPARRFQHRAPGQVEPAGPGQLACDRLERASTICRRNSGGYGAWCPGIVDLLPLPGARRLPRDQVSAKSRQLQTVAVYLDLVQGYSEQADLLADR